MLGLSRRNINRLRHIRSNGYQVDPYIRKLRILDMS
jgi:biotin operon repressor